MATLDRLTDGQVLYVVRRQKMGNTTSTKGSLFTMRVVEIDPVGRRVKASWNGNPATWYSERHVKNWKVNKPQPKGTRLGMPSY